MMHERGKSDEAIVAVKPTNNAERSACGVGGAKGRGQGECVPAKHAPVSVPGWRATGAGTHTVGWPWIPEVGAVCGKAACTDLCGGRSVMSVPTATKAP